MEKRFNTKYNRFKFTIVKIHLEPRRTKHGRDTKQRNRSEILIEPITDSQPSRAGRDV